MVASCEYLLPVGHDFARLPDLVCPDSGEGSVICKLHESTCWRIEWKSNCGNEMQTASYIGLGRLSAADQADSHIGCLFVA